MERGLLADSFPGGTASDLYYLVIGERLGVGTGRRTHVLNLAPSTQVVKVEVTSGSYQNVLEWEVWQTLRETPFGKRWLAPCRNISGCGIFLVMDRTYPPGPGFKWPKKIPKILTDRKRQNF